MQNYLHIIEKKPIFVVNNYTMTFRRTVKQYTEAPITHSVVMEMLTEYARPNDKISELVKGGELTMLRRGMYVAGPETDLPIPNMFVVANNLRGPSYVSLESALSYWGLIPERVYEISSVTLKTSKKYTNNLGRFSFQYLGSPYYSFGIESIRLTELQTALIASKEKALCDKIITTSGVQLRSVQQTIDFLTNDLRIDEEQLSLLDTHKIATWIEDAPKKNSLQMLIKALNTL
jgi:predicted transcriptional regulator of viral defense system